MGNGCDGCSGPPSEDSYDYMDYMDDERGGTEKTCEKCGHKWWVGQETKDPDSCFECKNAWQDEIMEEDDYYEEEDSRDACCGGYGCGNCDAR